MMDSFRRRGWLGIAGGVARLPAEIAAALDDFVFSRFKFIGNLTQLYIPRLSVEFEFLRPSLLLLKEFSQERLLFFQLSLECVGVE